MYYGIPTSPTYVGDTQMNTHTHKINFENSIQAKLSPEKYKTEPQWDIHPCKALIKKTENEKLPVRIRGKYGL